MVACCPGFTMVVHKTLSDMPFHLEPNSIMLHNKFQVGGRGQGVNCLLMCLRTMCYCVTIVSQ